MVAVAIFVVTYGTNVSTPFLVLYRDRLRLSDNQTMAIFVVYVVGIILALLLVGPLSDRFGRRPLALPFIALSAVGSLIIIPGRDVFALLLVGRFVLGVVSGAVLGVASAWILELLGRGHEQRAAVITTLVTYGGLGLGPLSSGLLERTLPAPLVTPFILHAAVTAVILPAVWRVPETYTPVHPLPRIRPRLGVPRSTRRVFVLLIVPAALWVFAFPSASFALFPVLVSDAVPGFDVAVASASGALTAWSGVSARPLLGRFGARRLLPIAMALGCVGYGFGAVAFGTGAWPLVLPSALTLGAASGAITAGCLTLLGEMAEDGTRGALTSTFYLLAYPGMAMPLVVTAIASVSSTGVGLAMMAGLAAISAIWVAVAAGRFAPQRSTV